MLNKFDIKTNNYDQSKKTKKITYQNELTIIETVLKTQIYNNIVQKNYNKSTNQQNILNKIDKLIESKILVGDNLKLIDNIKQYLIDLYKPKNISNIINEFVDKNALKKSDVEKLMKHI